MSLTCTTCPYCGVGCGVDVRTGAADATLTASVQGTASHPANFGRLCVKGSALGETLDDASRLLQPRIAGRPASWDTALDLIAARFADIRQRHGPEAIAFYLSGQLLTEDYYVANKLAKGFIGTPNVDTNSRLCMASATVAHQRAFGEDLVPTCYDDLEHCELALLIGSNAAWTHPVLFQRLVRAREQHPERRIVVLDPRRTATAELADLHLPLAPGSDAVFLAGLLVHLAERDALNQDYIARYTEGFDTALASARALAPDLASCARACRLPEADIARAWDWFACTPRALTLFSQGVNQTAQGSDTGNAVINLHLATGRIGRPGMGPFSLTGQPNAMGGREVGGLATQLAAHMGFSDMERDRVARFWGAPNLVNGPGLKAVDLFQAVESGQIRAVWVLATNPVISLPDAERFRRALTRCELLVVSDCVTETDTGRLAHIQLPAAAWGEKDGTVTNSERRISRQRPFREAPGEARPDWWALAQVGQRLGYTTAFDYSHPVQIFTEHAALTAFENRGERVLNLGPLAALDQTSYDALQPLQWPLRGKDNGSATEGVPRLFTEGCYPTPSGRARFLAAATHPADALPTLAAEPAVDAPLLLNSGRLRDQWHTMTRTGIPRLLDHCGESFVALHPEDAHRRQLREGDIVRVWSSRGEAWLRLQLDQDQLPGNAFVPMHWGDVHCGRGRINALLPRTTDPHSGQPASKHGLCAIAPWGASSHGLLLSREPLQAGDDDYWSRRPVPGGYALELASRADPVQSLALWQALLPRADDRVELIDASAGHYRMALFQGERLLAWLAVVRQPGQLPARDWLFGALQRPCTDADSRRQLLAGLGSGGSEGCLVCSCTGIGETRIHAAITAGCSDVAALGHKLGCGTHCGSCVPELRRLLRASTAHASHAASTPGEAA